MRVKQMPRQSVGAVSMVLLLVVPGAFIAGI